MEERRRGIGRRRRWRGVVGGRRGRGEERAITSLGHSRSRGLLTLIDHARRWMANFFDFMPFFGVGFRDVIYSIEGTILLSLISDQCHMVEF